MSKNIVVFSDGTGQEGGKSFNTNVYKVFNIIEDRTPRQIAYYERGVGTDWRRLLGNAGGRGFSQKICKCYKFIFDNYQSGDKIFLFGFSRGAATVRSLSGLIHMFGVLPQARPELIMMAYNIYRMPNVEARQAAAQAFIKRHHTMWCPIEFLGAWDTVAALGLPSKTLNVLVDKLPFWRHSFHNFKLSSSVRNGYHAIAIDDERTVFHPSLWDGLSNPAYQQMKQVWFCGSHTDIGGGYAETGGLSDIPLQWLVKYGQKHGLLIYRQPDPPLNTDPDQELHDPRRGVLNKLLYRRRMRSWVVKTLGNPVVHESVTRRTLNRYNRKSPLYKPWILQGQYDIEHDPYEGLIKPNSPLVQEEHQVL